MARIGVEAWMPHHADRQLGRRHGYVEAHDTPRFRPFMLNTRARNQRDQVRSSRNGKRIQKAWHDRNDVAPQAEVAQSLVHRPLPRAST